MLATRILTAIVLIALVLAALFLLPPLGWALVAMVVIALAATEWAQLAGFASSARFAFVAIVVVLMLVLLLLPAFGFERGWPARVVLTVCGAATVFWLVVVPPWLHRR